MFKATLGPILLFSQLSRHRFIDKTLVGQTSIIREKNVKKGEYH